MANVCADARIIKRHRNDEHESTHSGIEGSHHTTQRYAHPRERRMGGERERTTEVHAGLSHAENVLFMHSSTESIRCC